MNKSDLTELINKKFIYFKKKDIELCVHEIINFFSDNLSEGNRIEIRGFGTFSSRKRKARIARNPKTGTSLRVDEKFHPYFRASKSLKSNLKN